MNRRLSRSKNSGRNQAKEAEPLQPTPITPRERAVALAVDGWRESLTELSGGSALWDVEALGDALVELTAAHPSGVAQLFAGRPTRLSNLVREGSALAVARRRVRVVAARTEELAQRYGVAPTYVAMGIASWRTSLGLPTQSDDDGGAGSAHDGTNGAGTESDGASAEVDLEPGAGSTPAIPTSRVVRAPVLLRPVNLHVHGSDADINLELDPSVELNSVLVRDLQAHGVAIDSEAVAASTMTGSGFSPQAALDTIGVLGQALPEFHLERRIVLGAFVHPGQALAEDLDSMREVLPANTVIAGLANDDGARESAGSVELPKPIEADRDPRSEPGVGDLDRGQLHVLDSVATGAHLLVDTPPGADVPSTVAAVLAQAVTAGQRVVYMPGTRRAAQGITDRMNDAGIGSVVLDLSSDPSWRHNAVQRVVDGLNPPDPHDDPEIDLEAIEAERKELTETRTRLRAFVDALHNRRSPWGVSAYEAMQNLATLTSQRPGPRTQVRLTGGVINLDSGGRIAVREELARAAALGAFRLRAADTPWFGASLRSADHARSTLDKVRELDELMPTLMGQIDATAAQTGLDTARTLQQWSDQLELLQGVRASLDLFTSQVFERSAKDMAAAAGTRAWRAEKNFELTASERRRLRRQAQDLVRPGVSVPDLHAELILVERRREAWRKHCSGGAWPHIPSGLRDILATHEQVEALVEELNDVLSPTVGEQDLRAMELPDLATHLKRLGADDDAVRQMPERAAALAVLNSQGLTPLVRDLTNRRVSTELVGAEFELAWWSSVLEEMLATDPALSEIDIDSLAEVTRELRRLELRHIESLPIAVLRALRTRVRGAIESNRDQAQALYRAAHTGLTDLKEMLTKYGPPATATRPVWLVPPMVVPTVFPPGEQIDLLVLDAVTHLPVEHAIAAIARAKQVVIFGDTKRGGTGLVQALSWLPTITLRGDRMDQDPEIAAFLTSHGYEGLVRPIPAPPRPSPIRLHTVDGAGMPALDSKVVESVQAEVDQVVDLVIDHALSRPDESLAVIALNTRHADRVREAVASTVQGSRALESFFDRSRSEAFTVVEVESAAGLHRDAVILSLGFGKTPHGRVLHSFGSISGPDGAAYLVDALDAARHRLTVVSCFAAADLDPHRLRHDGSEMLRSVLQFAQDGIAPLELSETDQTPDPLLNDLTDRLRRRGLRVVPRYGRPSGVRLPLAVGHPALPGELVLAILTDDSDYVDEPSLRIRDRHWAQRLQNRGWNVRMVYSTAVFMDPQQVADEVAAQVSDIVNDRLGRKAAEPVTAPPPSVMDEDDPLVTTNATLSALRGEQIVGKLNAPEIAPSPLAGIRAERPAIQPGRPLGDYGDDELDALLVWIGSDATPRTAEELRSELAHALGLTRRGKHINAVLGHAVDRSGLAVAPKAEEAEEVEATEEGSEVTEDAAATAEDAEDAAAEVSEAEAPEAEEPEAEVQAIDADVDADSTAYTGLSAETEVDDADSSADAEVDDADADDTPAKDAGSQEPTASADEGTPADFSDAQDAPRKRKRLGRGKHARGAGVGAADDDAQQGTLDLSGYSDFANPESSLDAGR